MESRSGDDSVVPEPVVEAVKRTSSNIDEMEANLEELLSCCDAVTLSSLEPLERAQTLYLVSKAATLLFALRLRCRGVNLDDHPIKKELERMNLYEEKLQRCMDLSRAPLRPSVAVNSMAAARVIQHSLPQLSHEQRQRMRKISRGEGMKYLDRSHEKKRKHRSIENKSVRTAAQEFLEKAASELLGENKDGIKGPYQPVDTDGDVIILD